MAGTRRRAIALLGALVMLAPSCRTATEQFPPRPQVVSVTMREYGYDYEPPTASGRIVFNLENTGRVDHEAVLITLGDEIPPIDRQLRSGERWLERVGDLIRLTRPFRHIAESAVHRRSDRRRRRRTRYEDEEEGPGLRRRRSRPDDAEAV